MTVSRDNRFEWLALYMTPGLGNTLLKRLIDTFGTPEAVFTANADALMSVEGMQKEIVRKIMHRSLDKTAETELRNVEKCNARIVPYTDPFYPALLRTIHNPPMVLYVKGKEIPLTQTFVSVVGSRNATHYGRKAAERIGMGLAKRGVGVVSGLARGIDAAAHQGCLRGGGFTVAVVGTGIDRIYPQSNQKLFEQVEAAGTIASEFMTGTPPEPRNFPIRNRIISGLSRGTVVVEATRNSGSLITASLALEQGREVFAVPGSIDSFKSTGAHFLIKQGAKLIENADDILEEFGFLGRGMPAPGGSQGTEGPIAALDSVERTVFECIGDYPVHMDDIVRMTELDAGRVAGILMKLELEGLVKQLAGRMFIR